MSHLIDTDWVIDFLKGEREAEALFQRLLTGGIAISIITYLEVMEGIRRGRDPKPQALGFRRMLKRSAVNGISRSVAEQAADIRIALRGAQRSIDIRGYDILIAATAIEHGLIMVTRNTRDYRDKPGLRLYDPE
ncbi:MAG: type II toxin-antitoxin system VapC family toxin [Thermomicrobiales bacterium]